MNKPEISCVVPAYENIEFLSRCLMSILTQKNIKVEVIVCDDSVSTQVHDFVNLLSSTYSNLIYFRGPQSGNPIDNWNLGLDKSTAEYCLVVHHDEFIVDANYLNMAVKRMEEKKLDAMIVCSAVIGLKRYSRFSVIRRFMILLKRPLWLLLAFNWIGSTANVVFRKCDFKFDARLKYLVDVDFYLTILSKNLRYDFMNNIFVISIGHHSAQITSSYDFLSENIKELRYIASSGKYGITKIQYVFIFLIAKLRKFIGFRK